MVSVATCASVKTGAAFKILVCMNPRYNLHVDIFVHLDLENIGNRLNLCRYISLSHMLYLLISKVFVQERK